MNIQSELFKTDKKDNHVIISDALEYKPVAIYALFSGGDGSLAATHWAMQNVPNCEVAHIDTGIGIPRVKKFVKETCKRENWPLTVVRSKEDCGMDYEEIVRKHGFPGPSSHRYMYIQLKERAVAKLVRDIKSKRSDKVLLLTGVCHDDSARRSGYAGAEITKVGAQVWVNPQYWYGKSWTYHYIRENNLQRSPIAEELGMSGECLCGAFAGKGELAAVRIVCPATAKRIEKIQRRIHNLHPWGWEDSPPQKREDTKTIDMFSPMCVNCLKSPSRSTI